MSKLAEEARRQEAQKKAKNLRYQKPIAKELNFWSINEELWEIMEACEDVRWITEDEELLESAFDGDSEQAWEFRLMFTDLYSDCGKMRNAINAVEVWDEYAEDDPGNTPDYDDEPGENVPGVFDLFFPAIDADDGYLGFDSYENDYYGLDWYEGDMAKKFARKKIMRLTKEQILDAAGQCMRIARQYLALKYRYECLKGALDILRAEEQTVLKTVKAIEGAYDAAEKASEGFRYEYMAYKEMQELDGMLRELPERLWVE